MSDELKACPKCGRIEPPLRGNRPLGALLSEAWLSCKGVGCGLVIRVPGDTLHEALRTVETAWNTRPVDDAKDAEIERLRKALITIASDASSGADGSRRIDGTRRTPSFQERDCMNRIARLARDSLRPQGDPT